MPAIDQSLVERLRPVLPRLASVVRAEASTGLQPLGLTPSDFASIELHGLASLLDHGRRAGFLECDPVASSHLRQQSRIGELRADNALNQLVELGSALEECGIRAVVVKGGALAFHEYPYRGMRRFGDLDVLVHPSNRDAGCKALESLGYEWQSDCLGHSREYLLENHYHWSFARKDSILVELHWDLAPAAAGVKMDVPGILERSVAPLDGSARKFRVPSAEDHLLILAVHTARHQLMVPLRSYLDVAALLSAHPTLDWDVAWARAEGANAAADLAVMLGVVEHLGLVSLPSAATAPIRKHRLPIADLARYAVEWSSYDRPDGLIESLSASGPRDLLRLLFPAVPSAQVAEVQDGQSEGDFALPKRQGRGSRLIHRLKSLMSRTMDLGHLRAAVVIRRRFRDHEPE